MQTYRITYLLNNVITRSIPIRSPTEDLAIWEFSQVYPERKILSITVVKPFLKFVNMINYKYSLEHFKRGKWVPVFWPLQSSEPLTSEHLPYIEDVADMLSHKFDGEKFRIVKSEHYLIKSYGN